MARLTGDAITEAAQESLLTHITLHVFVQLVYNQITTNDNKLAVQENVVFIRMT